MQATKRSVYAFESNVFSVNAAGNQAQLAWKPDFAEAAFAHIMTLPEEGRVYVSTNEWFFYLADLKIDKRENDPTHEDCIYGWFEGVRIGFITDLKRLSTMTTRTNPKERDESEIRRTYFYLRLRDGLLLLDNFKENVVTYKRLEAYLSEKAPKIFSDYGIRYLAFVHKISTGFLEELEKFDIIRLAKIRLNLTPDSQYDTHDAIGSLQQLSIPTYANYIDLVLGRKNARKRGLITSALRGLLQKVLDKQHVVSGTIEGARSDGGSPTLKLHGVEEVHRKNFPKDDKGEVLPEPMFEYMIELGNK